MFLLKSKYFIENATGLRFERFYKDILSNKMSDQHRKMFIKCTKYKMTCTPSTSTYSVQTFTNYYKTMSKSILSKIVGHMQIDVRPVIGQRWRSFEIICDYSGLGVVPSVLVSGTLQQHRWSKTWPASQL